MALNGSFARQLRMRRLFRRGDGRVLIVPLDHSLTCGPITGGARVNHLVGELAANGADAVVLHKGALRYIDHHWFAATSLIVQLSASTMHAPDPDAKYLVATVEEALRLGADAVSVHVNLGSKQEGRQISDLASVADICDKWNMPLLAMMYPRGPGIVDSQDPTLIAHAATLAADLGADIVKTPCAATAEQMAVITKDCPVPLVVAGGPRRSDIPSFVSTALVGGAAGVAMGRNVFQSADPGRMTRVLAELIHGQSPHEGAWPTETTSM